MYFNQNINNCAPGRKLIFLGFRGHRPAVAAFILERFDDGSCASLRFCMCRSITDRIPGAVTTAQNPGLGAGPGCAKSKGKWQTGRMPIKLRSNP